MSIEKSPKFFLNDEPDKPYTLVVDLVQEKKTSFSTVLMVVEQLQKVAPKDMNITVYIRYGVNPDK